MHCNIDLFKRSPRQLGENEPPRFNKIAALEVARQLRALYAQKSGRAGRPLGEAGVPRRAAIVLSRSVAEQFGLSGELRHTAIWLQGGSFARLGFNRETRTFFRIRPEAAAFRGLMITREVRFISYISQICHRSPTRGGEAWGHHAQSALMRRSCGLLPRVPTRFILALHPALHLSTASGSFASPRSRETVYRL